MHEPLDINALQGLRTGHSIRPLRRSKRRRRRLVLLFVALLVLPAGWSFGRALTYPGSASMSVRSVEWLRENGGGGFVNRFEEWYFTRHHPPTSGLPTGPFPTGLSANARSAIARIRMQQRLPTLHPGIPPTLPGEASLKPGPVGQGGRPGIYTGWYRVDPGHPTLVAGALWMDPSVVRLDVIPGTKEPGGSHWPGNAQIPPDRLNRTVAAFNSGFKMQDSRGGFFKNGRTEGTLRRGAASLVIDLAGRATIEAWPGGSPARNVSAVRQNLRLIVDHGRAAKGLVHNSQGLWGSRKSQLEYVWRSGIGIDARGRLVYIAGNKFTLTTLSEALIQAGAVRAMQLDIHNEMVTANLYRPATKVEGVRATKLLPAMPRPATRYLRPDQRDFLTVTLR